MALSVSETAKSLWRKATRDIPNYEQGSALYLERFELMNRAIQYVIPQFADLLAPSYKVKTTAVPSTTGRYSTATGTWVASTNTLTITMDSNFSSSDIEHTVMFRVGTSVYLATIQSRTSNTAVVLHGDNLPTSNQTVDYAMMASTGVTSDVLSLASLRMFRNGQQDTLEFESSSTTNVEYLKTLAFRKWSTTAQQNKNALAFMFAGVNLYMKKGSSTSSYGTIYPWYPKLPDLLAADADGVDVPDGAPMELVIFYLRSLIMIRLGQEVPNDDKDLEVTIKRLYATYGSAKINNETVKQKASALKNV